MFLDDWKDHVGHIKKVLLELRMHGLTAKPGKYEWDKCERK